jgi:two-component system capsular synthesis sensor histidine kinase RcsC
MRACALAETVRDLGLSCDVVVVTSHLTPDETRRYAMADVERVLTKPVTLAHLRSVLARVSRRRGVHAVEEGARGQDMARFMHGSTA